MTLNRWAAFHRNVVWRVVWRGGVGCGLALGASLLAADPTPGQKIDLSTIDKSKYSLLHPTPAKYLREMSTDRPDKTESPFTVDAGHFQIEADLLSYTRDRDTASGADTRLDSYAVAPVNLKAGLCNHVDLQVVLGTFNYVRTDDRVAGTVTRQRGFGDVTTRLKVNFWATTAGRRPSA